MSSLRQSDAATDLGRAGRSARLRALEPAPRRRLARSRRFEGYRGAIAFALLASALIAVVWLAPVAALDASAEAVAWLELRLTPSGQALATIALGTIALLALVIAWARRTALARPVNLPAGGRIAVDEVAARLTQMIEERDDVRRAEVRIDNLHRRGLRVSTTLHVTAQANLTGAIQTVSEAAELLLHGHLLVRLSSPPSVELHFDELDLRSGRVHDQRTSAAHR